MHSITIKQITVPYEKELLQQWKQRDSKVVPAFMLDWNGPGISNGYGFGEWLAEQYFRNHGYYVLTNDFNLLSKTSKFRRYNTIIETMIQLNRLNEFKKTVQHLVQEGYTIENPDLFVYNLQTLFFVEVKKERDKLREPQLRFMYLAKELLQTDSKLVYLSDDAKSISTEEVTFEFTLPPEF